MKTSIRLQKVTGIRPDRLLSMLAHSLVSLWHRQKKISFPPLSAFIMDEEQARKHGLIED